MEASPIRLEQEEVTSALADTDKLMEEMQIQPFKEGTDPGGFKIGKVKPGSIFAKMGLRTGDVVTGVNNEAITGVEQAEDLYSSLLEGGDIALEVKRGGRTQKLQLAIE
jgi:type II secretory pathway component PulC